MSPGDSQNGASRDLITPAARRPIEPIRNRDCEAKIEFLREQLELQKTQLANLRRRLEVADERHADVFDFAPAPYLALDGAGTVNEINLAGAAFLGTERGRILGLPLRHAVVFSDRPVFLEHMRLCRSQRSQVVSQVRMNTARGKKMHVQITSRQSLRVLCRVPSYPTTLTDLTERDAAISARDVLLRQLFSVQEDERRRLSRELHDEMGQHVTSLLLGLRSLTVSQPADKAKLEQLLSIADSLGQEAHRIATNLRPTALDDLGLDSALRHYVADWGARNRIQAEYDRLGQLNSRFAPDVETTLYRCVQEALTNVARHSGAAHVSVILDAKPAEVHVIVEDDGTGCDVASVFATAGTTGRLGIVGMRERVELQGGGLQMESSPSGGTSVFIRIPIQRSQADIS